MQTLIVGHPDIWLHDAAASHVQMATQRVRRVHAAVSAVPGVASQLATPATREQFLRVHEADFFDDLVRRAPPGPGERRRFDGETIMNEHTLRALELSAGAMCQAVDAVLDGTATNAFCPVYAGHHAAPGLAAGFCFTNPAAIAARHARARGLERVAVLDFDTHSGNGTILALMDQPGILFAETYQPGYPFNFLPGRMPANVLRHRVKTQYDFRHAWPALLDAVARFAPQLIVVSAGFDAHRADPLGSVGLDDADYAWLGAEIMRINPAIVAGFEGGYDLDATARCAALFVARLAGRPLV